MFYTYNQNNSYGYFQTDDKVSEIVIIEAESPDEANEKAEKIGIYFGGGGDCPCCGNRWHEAYEGTQYPEVYGTLVADSQFFEDVCIARKRIIIYYASGTKSIIDGPRREVD
jgi:hypothetical protein